MIFEVFFDSRTINSHPPSLMLVGFIYSSIALLLAFIVFREYASIVMVFFAVMALLPLVYNSVKHEEHEDVVLNDEVSMLKEHAKTLKKFMYLFIGLVLGFSFWYAILPMEVNSEIYEAQISTIGRINGQVASHFGSYERLTGYLIKERFPIFMSILMNNLIVLVFCLLFSLIFGLGAIFILTWNASIIGVAIGSIIKEGFMASATLVGGSRLFSYAQVLSCGLMRFTFHGIPEIGAYFVGGLAGGIVSVAVIRHELYSKKFRKIIFDSMDLAVIAVLLLLLAAIIEVFFSPMIC